MLLRIFVSIAILCTVLVAPPGLASEENRQRGIMEELDRRAEVFVREIATGTASRVRGQIDTSLRPSLNDEALRQMFGAFAVQSGRLEEIGRASSELQRDGSVRSRVPMHYEQVSYVAVVTFERQGGLAKISGFTIEPAGPDTPARTATANKLFPPPYGEPMLVREVVLGAESGGDDEPGEEAHAPLLVRIPRTASESRPVPGVLILTAPVPGAGTDRDQAVIMGYDLSWGLASKGIAAATLVLPSAWIDGAETADALRALGALAEVDAARLHVVAHGWSALAAVPPARRVALRGLVLLDPVEVPASSALRAANAVDHDPVLDAFARDLGFGSADEEAQILGLPGSRWASWQRRDFPGDLMAAGTSILLVARDEGGAVNWIQQGATGQAGTRARIVRNGLDHYFRPSEQTGTEHKGRVPIASQVVEDAASFVLRGRVSGPMQ